MKIEGIEFFPPELDQDTIDRINSVENHQPDRYWFKFSNKYFTIIPHCAEQLFSSTKEALEWAYRNINAPLYYEIVSIKKLSERIEE